jgi:hypothetical protein
MGVARGRSDVQRPIPIPLNSGLSRLHPEALQYSRQSIEPHDSDHHVIRSRVPAGVEQTGPACVAFALSKNILGGRGETLVLQRLVLEVSLDSGSSLLRSR